MPPSNSLMASARASIVSRSRWLVGSSRNSMWGFCQASQAKHTRHFWPSDRFLIGLTLRTKEEIKLHTKYTNCNHSWCGHSPEGFGSPRWLLSGGYPWLHIKVKSNPHLLFSSQAVAADDLPHLVLLLDLGVALHHVLQRRQVQVQLLCEVLQARGLLRLLTGSVIHSEGQHPTSLHAAVPGRRNTLLLSVIKRQELINKAHSYC